MQLAEEKQSGWLQVPRIGYFALPVTDIRGGVIEAEELMDKAIKAALAQWTKGVAPHVEMIAEIYEPLEGELRFNERGEVEGPARAKFPNGNIYEVNHKGGRKHGQGTAKYATGNVYVGQFENDKKHGRGTFTWADGDVEVGFYEEGKGKGPASGWRRPRASSGFSRTAKRCSKSANLRRGAAFSIISLKVLFMLAPGQRGGEGARPAGAALLTALHVMSCLQIVKAADLT